MDLSSISLSKFSPLRTPVNKTSHKKQSIFDYVSEAESTVSAVTRDIHNLAKSVKQKLKATSDTDDILSGTDFSQSKLQYRKNGHMPLNAKVSRSDASSDSNMSGSETDQSIVSPSKKINTPNSVSEKGRESQQVNSGKNSKSPWKQKRRESLSSVSSDPSDSDASSEDKNRKIKGGNSKQSVKRAHSVSSSSSPSSASDDESESILSSSKKQRKTNNVGKRKSVENAEVVSDISDISDSDSDISSVIDVKSSSGVSLNTSHGTKKDKNSEALREIDRLFSGSDSDSSEEQTSSKNNGAASPVSSAHSSKVSSQKSSRELTPKKSTSKNQLRYEIPDNFEVDTSQDCLTSKDIKGKQLWLIMAPNDVDITCLHGQHIDMKGISNFNIDNDEGEKQYEVITQPYVKDRTKTYNTVALKTRGEQDYVVGPEINGQIQVMNWIPTMPPVQLTKSKPTRHSIPDNLKYKLEPFGSESPTRHIEDTVIDKPHKHKKKKKKKDKTKS